MPTPLIVDAHEDIAWNKLALGRDFRESVDEKRRKEGENPAHGEGSAMIGLPDLIAGNVRVVFSTVYVAQWRPDRQSWGKTYTNPQEAHDQGKEQIAYYESLTSDPRIAIVKTKSDLEAVIRPEARKIGLVILMEGADPIISPGETRQWFESGVRIVGPAWSQTRYSGGTRAPGGLTPLGRELMPQLQSCGMILDTSHMAEQSFFDALELFHGNVIASHSNCRTYVNTDRQLTDEMIRTLISRDGVIGTVFYNNFLVEGWDKSARKDDVSLVDVVKHMKRVCDFAGDAKHVGIGTDMDGGFGMQSTPKELNTVADLYRLGDALAPDFSDDQINDILGGNWIRLLLRSLPE